MQRLAPRRTARILISFLPVLAVACGGAPSSGEPPAPAGEGASPAAAIDAFAAELWEAYLARFPREATFVGDRRYDDALVDLSAPAIDTWLERREDFARRLAAIDTSALVGQRRVTAAVLADWMTTSLERARACEEETWDVDQLAGHQVTLPQLGRLQKVDSMDAAAKYVTRLSKVAALFRQHVDNLERGVRAGRTAPRIVVERVIGQLQAMLERPIGESPYLGAVEKAEGLDDAQRARLRADVEAVEERGVRAGLRHYLDYLEKTYLPAARTVVGVSGNQGGAACYAALARYYTGSEKTPEMIHQVGKDELERLHAEMNRLAKAEGAADWRAYMAALQADPAQYLDSREALVKHNEALVARATAALPEAFGLLPPIPVGVIRMEEFREADSPAAYYYEASDDGSRPAYYYINTYQPHTRPLYNMEALAFHEAVPGHHLQISIAQKLQGLPDIRRHGSHTAYVEGWALYAELVAGELGLYSSPATRVGMYNYQAWRAARLVVDTGMHALGWSREDALRFMTDNVALPEDEIANEIDRYIIWPGQALGYMLGRMELQELRREAQEALGDAFDLRAFHDAVLANGAVPMGVLRELVHEWLATHTRAARG